MAVTTIAVTMMAGIVVVLAMDRKAQWMAVAVVVVAVVVAVVVWDNCSR